MLKIAEGEALVTLADGTELTLRIDHETMIRAEDIADLPWPVLIGRLKSGRMGAMRSMITAALQPHHPDIDPKQVATLCFTQTEAMFIGLQQAMERAFPDAVKAAAAAAAEGKEPGNRQARRATAAAGGKASSKAGAKRASSHKDGSA